MGEAMARAESAHAKINAHEDLCAERYSHIASSNEAMKGQMAELKGLIKESAVERKGDIGKIYDFLWKVSFGLVGLLIAIIFLLIKEMLLK